MSNDGKNNAEGDALGGEIRPNGTARVPGAAFYDSEIVRREIGELLESIGGKVEDIGATLKELGRLLPSLEGTAAVFTGRGVSIEIRYLRDLLSHLENNLPGGPLP